jgi:hypothetical protein
VSSARQSLACEAGHPRSRMPEEALALPPLLWFLVLRVRRRRWRRAKQFVDDLTG